MVAAFYAALYPALERAIWLDSISIETEQLTRWKLPDLSETSGELATSLGHTTTETKQLAKVTADLGRLMRVD